MLQYERLVDFCYACGRLTHVEKNCFEADIAPTSYQFEDWLRYLGYGPHSSLNLAADSPP